MSLPTSSFSRKKRVETGRVSNFAVSLRKDMKSGLTEGQACLKAVVLKTIDKRARSVVTHKPLLPNSLNSIKIISFLSNMMLSWIESKTCLENGSMELDNEYLYIIKHIISILIQYLYNVIIKIFMKISV